MPGVKQWVWLLLAAFALAPGFPARGAEAPPAVREYSIGVIPSVPPVPTHTQWAPFVERLAQDTGLSFRLKLYEQMADFERDIVSPQAPDFIFAHALQLVVAHQAQGYLPLVRGSAPIRAVLFVARDSPVQTVDDLQGKKIAYVGSKNL